MPALNINRITKFKRMYFSLYNANTLLAVCGFSSVYLGVIDIPVSSTEDVYRIFNFYYFFVDAKVINNVGTNITKNGKICNFY